MLTLVLAAVALDRVVGAARDGVGGALVGDGAGVKVGVGGAGVSVGGGGGGALRLIMVSLWTMVLLARSCPLLLGLGRISTEIG